MSKQTYMYIKTVKLGIIIYVMYLEAYQKYYCKAVNILTTIVHAITTCDCVNNDTLLPMHTADRLKWAGHIWWAWYKFYHFISEVLINKIYKSQGSIQYDPCIKMQYQTLNSLVTVLQTWSKGYHDKNSAPRLVKAKLTFYTSTCLLGNLGVNPNKTKPCIDPRTYYTSYSNGR